jgi:adenosylcobinamide-GDP ribazoletransferase
MTVTRRCCKKLIGLCLSRPYSGHYSDNNGLFGWQVFHPDLVTGLILLVYVLSNGGFHLDGLADTFDAIAAKSEGTLNADKQKRLSILKDAATGPIGVTAIVFSLGLKYLSLNNLTHFSPFAYYSSLLLFGNLKWTMVISFYGKPAEDGLGCIFINKIGREIVISL